MVGASVPAIRWSNRNRNRVLCRTASGVAVAARPYFWDALPDRVGGEDGLHQLRCGAFGWAN
jgi:hypothetical protein